MYVYPFIALVLPVSACGLDQCVEWYNSFKTTRNITYRYGITCGVIGALLLISFVSNPYDELEAFYESYTTADQTIAMEPGRYYRIPFELKKPAQIDGFEIQMNRIEDGTQFGKIYGNLLDRAGTVLDTFAFDSTTIPSYHWTRILCDWQLNAGNYMVELYTTTPLNVEIIGGTVFGNGKALQVDGYPVNGLAADLKLMENVTYPIQYYGDSRIDLVNVMSWQTYAQDAFR